ncbi:hypothetical protein GCM10027051_32610 [Niabella terrae]
MGFKKLTLSEYFYLDKVYFNRYDLSKMCSKYAGIHGLSLTEDYAAEKLVPTTHKSRDDIKATKNLKKNGFDSDESIGM